MKFVKKVLVCALVLSLSLSVLCISGNALTEDNYRDILDYYEKSTYLIENYDRLESGEYTDGILNASSEQSALIEGDGDNKYLSLYSGKLGPSGTFGNIFAGFDLCENAKQFIFEAEITPSKDLTDKNSKYPIVRFYFGEGSLPVPEFASIAHTAIFGYPVLSLNFKSYPDKMTVKYFDGNSNSEIALDGSLDFTSGSSYKVIIFFDNGRYSFEVFECGNEANAIALSDCAYPINSVGNVRVGTAGNDMTYSSIVGIDNLVIYEAEERRYPLEVQERVDEWFVQLAELIGECDYETRLDMVSVAKRIIDEYGYTTTDEDVLAAIEEILAVQAQLLLYEENCEAFIQLYDGVDLYVLSYEEQAMLKSEAERILSLGVDFTYPNFATYYDTYLNSDEIMETVICSRFIQSVIDAENALYLSVRIRFLDDAYSDLEIIDEKQFDIPGVAEAKVKCDLLKEVFDRMLKDAENYVAAVKAINADAGRAIEGSMTQDEPLNDEFKLTVKAAIDAAVLDNDFISKVNAAVALSQNGNISGIPGVAAANVVLSLASAKISDEVIVSQRYSYLYATLFEASSPESYYAILSELSDLSGMLGEADEENKNRVDKATANYNAQVNAINSAFGTVNETAAKINAGAQGAESIASAVSVVAAYIIVLFAVNPAN